MDNLSLKEILESHNAYIIAPAGHGKTEMIADIVKVCSEDVLVLTHTNAGVEAIRRRLRKKGFAQARIHVGTIAGFCQKWCLSYPRTSCIDPALSRFEDSNAYYAQLYSGAKLLFSNAWARQVVLASYKAIIIDEYQDCIIEQHDIFLTLNQEIPVWVFGDPLQGIFDWRGNRIINWTKLSWKEVKVNTLPWRWKNTNPELGAFLADLRKDVEPILHNHPISLQLRTNNSYLRVISPFSFNGFNYFKEWNLYNSVLYVTDFESSQVDFCKSMGGFFQVDEKQDCNILYENARLIDSSLGCTLLRVLLEFSSCCASNVKTEFNSYISRLINNSTDFSHIKKHFEIGNALLNASNGNIKMIIYVLHLIFKCSDLKFYRKELFFEMIRSLRYADNHKISVEDAAKHIRSDADLQKRYSNFKFLASRTLLSKGLEFECVIIDMRRNIRAKDFYVAMTRATKMIYVITSNTHLSFNS